MARPVFSDLYMSYRFSVELMGEGSHQVIDSIGFTKVKSDIDTGDLILVTGIKGNRQLLCDYFKTFPKGKVKVCLYARDRSLLGLEPLVTKVKDGQIVNIKPNDARNLMPSVPRREFELAYNGVVLAPFDLTLDQESVAEERVKLKITGNNTTYFYCDAQNLPMSPTISARLSGINIIKMEEITNV